MLGTPLEAQALKDPVNRYAFSCVPEELFEEIGVVLSRVLMQITSHSVNVKCTK